MITPEKKTSSMFYAFEGRNREDAPNKVTVLETWPKSAKIVQQRKRVLNFTSVEDLEEKRQGFSRKR